MCCYHKEFLRLKQKQEESKNKESEEGPIIVIMLLCSCSHHVIFLYLLFHLPHTYPSSDLGAHGCGVRGMKMFRSSSEDVIKRGSIVDDWGPGWGGGQQHFSLVFSLLKLYIPWGFGPLFYHYFHTLL